MGLRRCVPHGVLGAVLLLLLGALVGGTEQEKSLADLISTVCDKGEPPPLAYIVGRTYETMLGAAVMHLPVVPNVPFLAETLLNRSYAPEGKIEDARCRRFVSILHEKLYGLSSSTRFQTLRACATPNLAHAPPALVDHLLSDLALRAHAFSLPVLCALLDDPRILEVLTDGGDCASWRDGEGGEWSGNVWVGKCVRWQSGLDPLWHALPEEVKEGEDLAMREDEGQCDHAYWWNCRSGGGGGGGLHALPEGLGRGEARRRVRRASAGVSDLLDQWCHGTIDRAFEGNLARRAEPAGKEAYLALCRQGADYAEFRGHLRESHEYTRRCKTVKCKEADKKSVAIYREILMREPSLEDQDAYSVLLARSGLDEDEMRQILTRSAEYRDLCVREEGDPRLGCKEALRVARQTFNEVMEREPDARGLVVYARELSLNFTSVERIEEDLRSSAEFRDRVSLKKKGGVMVERVKDLLPACRIGETTWDRAAAGNQVDLGRMSRVSGLVRHWPASENLSRADFVGRWCQAGEGCAKDHTQPCSAWPPKVARMVESALLGGLPLEDLETVVRDPLLGGGDARRYVSKDGRVAVGARGRLDRATSAISSVRIAFTDLLGRYPDPQAFRDLVPQFMNGELDEAHLRGILGGSGERKNKVEIVLGADKLKWVARIEAMVALMARYSVKVPDDVAPCFGPGYVLSAIPSHVTSSEGYSKGGGEDLEDSGKGSFYCRAIPGHTVAEAGDLLCGAAECLPGRAAWGVCAEGRSLCRPVVGQAPMEGIKEYIRESEEPGLPGLRAATVYFPGGREGGGGGGGEPRVAEDACHAGTVLRRLQLVWNEESPLMGKAPLASPPLPEGGEAEGKGDGGNVHKGRVPIAVYVHDRPDLFAQVLVALKGVRGIERVPVLVISMDSVSRRMLALAEAIRFAPVRIVFHPVRQDMVSEEPVLAIKNHWWWLQVALWRHVRETREHTGSIALLEEDHLVTPDFLQVMGVLLRMQDSDCPQCWGVCVRYGCGGKDDHLLDQKQKSVQPPGQDRLAKVCRIHAVINTGIAFNRDTFERIERSDFLDFMNGWDWSLFHLLQTLQLPDMMLAPSLSRIRNIGTAGATVSEADLQLHIISQLQYDAAPANIKFDEDAFWIDTGEAMAYTPPCWEPLNLGLVEFVSKTPQNYS